MDQNDSFRRKIASGNPSGSVQQNLFTSSKSSTFSSGGSEQLFKPEPPLDTVPSGPSRTNWPSQVDSWYFYLYLFPDTVFVAVDIVRELTKEEVALVKNVASTLDPSIDIMSRQREGGMKVIIVYDALVVQCAIQSIRVLIQGLASISPCPAPRETTEKPGVSPLTSLQTSKKMAPKEKPSLTPPGTPTEETTETPGVFERPLSLKGQRHVFLYKCRYSLLKAIIDRSGCWGLRMASLEDKWPCLVVYCAKDRETWMNAFHKIQKLERNDFYRKKIADSLKNVDLKKLEDLTAAYGQK